MSAASIRCQAPHVRVGIPKARSDDAVRVVTFRGPLPDGRGDGGKLAFQVSPLGGAAFPVEVSPGLSHTGHYYSESGTEA